MDSIVRTVRAPWWWIPGFNAVWSAEWVCVPSRLTRSNCSRTFNLSKLVSKIISESFLLPNPRIVYRWFLNNFTGYSTDGQKVAYIGTLVIFSSRSDKDEIVFKGIHGLVQIRPSNAIVLPIFVGWLNCDHQFKSPVIPVLSNKWLHNSPLMRFYTFALVNKKQAIEQAAGDWQLFNFPI